jgi:transposase
MPTKRLAMRNLREVFRLKWDLGRSHREIAAAVGIGASTVSLVVQRAVAAGLTTWAAVAELDGATLEARLYPPAVVNASGNRTKSDWAKIHAEMQHKAMTLQLLHEEYQQGGGAYSYTQFCRDYRRYVAAQKLVMRQCHAPGDKLFVDFSGLRPVLTDPRTGATQHVELFVAVLGASNYTYVEAVRTQQIADWLGCHQRALAYFGGVPRTLVPDQLKAAVTRSCRFDPGIQRNFDELATHYGTVVMPARPGKPRDKAAVEVGVQIAQRWILQRMRKQTFFSLAEMNARIGELREDLNTRVMRRYQQSRRERFLAIEQPTLAPLPTTAFEFAPWHKVRASADYHVTVEHHAYSVPYQHAGAVLWARVSATTVELFADGVHATNGQRLALHVRSREVGGSTTQDAHRSHAHRQHLGWNVARLQTWAATIGAHTTALVTAMLANGNHPERTFRACLGLVALANHYDAARLDAACQRALALGALRSASVKSILVRGLDRVSATAAAEPPSIGDHANLRGADYYN